jgi:predicted Zn-dependent protease
MFKIPYRRALLIVSALSVFVVFAVIASASHSWGGYHWARTSNPFTLRVGRNVSSNWTTAFNTAVSDWNAASVMNLTTVTGTAGTNCAMVRGTVQVCNGSYGNTGWLGIASINLATGTRHIVQGSAKMNDTYFNTSTYNNPNEKLHVMCQEVGHTFGLGHTSEDGSSQNTCMDYFSNTGANATSTISTHPNSHDYSMLSSIYAHLDGSTTIAARTASETEAAQASAEDAGSDITDDPISWGHLVSQSKNGRSSTYERSNPNGSRTLTHVFWTEEAAANNPGGDHRFHHHH